jgi:hypothetical protein
VGGQVIENLGHEPVTVYSKSELRREAAKRGLEPMVQHKPPDPASDKGSPAVKKTQPLTRDQMRLITQFEDLMTQMGLQFWMRCKTCADAGGNDAVWGNNEQTSNRLVIECSCTTREYRGADVPVPSRAPSSARRVH